MIDALKHTGQSTLLRSIGIVILIMSFCGLSNHRTVVAQDKNQPIDFNQQIRPLLNEHCTACHGGVKQAGDVSFIYRNQVVPPDGWVVEPGDPESSILIDRVKSTDLDERMPPPEHGRALHSHEIDLLTKWIEQGADWDGHWAYVAPTQPETPKTKNSNWPRQSVDAFVLAKLEKLGVQPAGDAAPERWLRRATLDITGLPPALEQRQTFLDELAELGESAYEHAVDRLLAESGYGERWASVWLDQVRYADSKGLGLDGKRNIWKYRDWVIDSLNQDLPYDQFTIQQIAGDLLPEPTIEDWIATAAHRTTQTNEEGGTDDEEFRIAAVLDRVNTTWQAWQGVTFGCVQCHSHPYDPIRHDEYYKFVAFFNNTADTDLGEEWPVLKAPIEKGDYERASQLDREIASLRLRTWHHEYDVLTNDNLWQPVSQLRASTNNKTQVKVERVGDHEEFHTVGTVSQNTNIRLVSTLPPGIDRLTAIRLTGKPLDPAKAATDSEWGFVLSHIEAKLIDPVQENPQAIEFDRLIIDEPDPFYDPQESLNPKSRQGFATYTRIYQPRTAALVLKTPLDIEVGSKLEINLKHRGIALGAFPLITRRGQLAVSNRSEFADQLSNASYIQNRERLNALKKERAAIKSTSLPILKERPKHLARSTHVFIRGLFLTKDKQVSPDVPESFPPLPDNMPANRLALANWMVSPDNPLTARVAVNRIWARVFGIGLVATEEDFGSSGEIPSHPALLDHLAVRFQNELGWSQKELLKEFILSRTYRQSSKVRTELQEQDPHNRLLARGPRPRLSAEMVRDQALAVSGLLSPKLFGPPVHPPIPAGVWRPFAGGDKWKTPDSKSPDRYRRSIYTYTKRSIPYPMFAAFDSPSREICTPRRLRSNTPIQALMTLNDATFSECAAALGQRMMASADSAEEQITTGFLLLTCRKPNLDELEELVQLLQSYPTENRIEGFQSVASVLLNLDEAVTK